MAKHYNGSPYWDQRTTNANKARAHFEFCKQFPIYPSFVYTSMYSYDPTNVYAPYKPSIVTLTNRKTMETYKRLRLRYPYAIICALNFASYKNPGGRFLDGSMAQEESICHETNLYNVLLIQEDYYEWNKRHLNRALYMNRAIYSQNVIHFDKNRLSYLDVLTCAAPNKGIAQRYNNITNQENYEVLYGRIKFIHDIMVSRNIDIAILGAFGCGVFKQKASDVAKAFREIFSDNKIPLIYYAVPDDIYASNYKSFMKEFSKEPSVIMEF